MGNKGALSAGNGAALRAYNEKKRQDKLALEKKQETKELTEAGIIPVTPVEVSKVVADPKPTLIPVNDSIKASPVQTKEKNNTKMNLNIDPSKNYQFELVEKSTANRNVIVGATNRIFDTEVNRIRQIRYVPIADTIYEDEMDPSFMDMSSPYLGFNNNYMAVAGSDVRLLEYLMAHDDNEANPKRLGNRPPTFRLIDNDLIEKNKTVAYDLLDEVRELIKAKDADELRPIARVLYGIDSNDDNVVRNALRDRLSSTNMADSSKAAKTMLDNIANPKLDRQYQILTGFDRGILSLKPDHNCVVWVNTGTLVCNVRNIKDQNKVAGELAEWTFLHEDGQRFWEVYSKKI